MDNSDRTQPTSSSIVITSDPGDDATYGAGDFIEVRVTLSDDVNIIGVPQLELDLDGEGKTDQYVGTWQGASQETDRANSDMNLRVATQLPRPTSTTRESPSEPTSRP